MNPIPEKKKPTEGEAEAPVVARPLTYWDTFSRRLVDDGADFSLALPVLFDTQEKLDEIEVFGPPELRETGPTTTVPASQRSMGEPSKKKKKTKDFQDVPDADPSWQTSASVPHLNHSWTWSEPTKAPYMSSSSGIPGVPSQLSADARWQGMGAVVLAQSGPSRLKGKGKAVESLAPQAPPLRRATTSIPIVPSTTHQSHYKLTYPQVNRPIIPLPARHRGSNGLLPTPLQRTVTAQSTMPAGGYDHNQLHSLTIPRLYGPQAAASLRTPSIGEAGPSGLSSTQSPIPSHDHFVSAHSPSSTVPFSLFDEASLSPSFEPGLTSSFESQIAAPSRTRSRPAIGEAGPSGLSLAQTASPSLRESVSSHSTSSEVPLFIFERTSISPSYELTSPSSVGGTGNLFDLNPVQPSTGQGQSSFDPGFTLGFGSNTGHWNHSYQPTEASSSGAPTSHPLPSSALRRTETFLDVTLSEPPATENDTPSSTFWGNPGDWDPYQATSGGSRYFGSFPFERLLTAERMSAAIQEAGDTPVGSNLGLDLNVAGTAPDGDPNLPVPEDTMIPDGKPKTRPVEENLRDGERLFEVPEDEDKVEDLKVNMGMVRPNWKDIAQSLGFPQTPVQET